MPPISFLFVSLVRAWRAALRARLRNFLHLGCLECAASPRRRSSPRFLPAQDTSVPCDPPPPLSGGTAEAAAMNACATGFSLLFLLLLLLFGSLRSTSGWLRGTSCSGSSLPRLGRSLDVFIIFLTFCFLLYPRLCAVFFFFFLCPLLICCLSTVHSTSFACKWQLRTIYLHSVQPPVGSMLYHRNPFLKPPFHLQYYFCTSRFPFNLL